MLQSKNISVYKFISFICVLSIVLNLFSAQCFVHSDSKLYSPKSISVNPVSTGIKVIWSKVKSAEGYYIYRKKSDSNKFTRIAKISDTDILTYIDKNAKSCNYYVYAIKSYDDITSSSYTESNKKYYVKAPELSSIKNNYGSVTVKWKKIKDVSGYRLYRKTSNGSWRKIKTLKGDDKLTYTDKKVSDGKKYFYSLKAYKGDRVSVRGISKSLKFKKKNIEITLNKSKLSLKYGKTAKLIAAPSINKVSVKWKSSDPSVATVNTRGKVTAISVGTAKITAYFKYNGKRYSRSCKVTVKEIVYNVGDTVNLEGKATFKIKSVRAHSQCSSSISASAEDRVIITYSYKNINCIKKIKIDNDNLVISDSKGEVGAFVDDCLHCVAPKYCTEGVSQKTAVVVALLDNKGKYCNLRLALNITEYAEVTAKFKLNINRSYTEVLSDESAYGILGSSINTIKYKLKNKKSFKVSKAVCDFENNRTAPSFKIQYQYRSSNDRTVTKFAEIWVSEFDNPIPGCKVYNYNGEYLYIQELTEISSFDFEFNLESVLKTYVQYPKLKPI